MQWLVKDKMWRYLFGLPRARIQWNGTWRSTPPTSYRDDNGENQASQNTLSAHRTKCQHSKENDGGQIWQWNTTDYHRRSHCNFNTFGDLIFISSTLVLTCHVSQLWKSHLDEHERRQKFLLLERVKQESWKLLNVHPSVYVKQSRSKLEKDVSWPKSPPRQNDSTVSEKNQPSEVKKVRFDVDFSRMPPNVLLQKEEEKSVKTAHEKKYEQLYAEFEDSWKDLCERYDKMKCNRKGVRAAESGDYGQALSYFETASTAGCAKAFFNMALMYESGVGSAKDLDQAIDLYKQAVEFGSGEAAHNLALIYLNRDRSGDRDLAIDMLKEASASGVTESMTELGVLYAEMGETKQAFDLFTKAGKEEDADGLYMLGVCYENGLGVEQNECKAAECYRKASAAGNNHAQYNLAFFFQHGIGGLPMNKQSAVELFEKSANSGNSQAAEKLREILSEENAYNYNSDCSDDVISLRTSSSSPVIFSYLQNHLSEINHWDWGLSVPSLHKSSTHTGVLKANEFNQHGVDLCERNADSLQNITSDNGDSVSFTVGDECDEIEESSTGWSSDVTGSSLILDGGFADLSTNLSLVKTTNQQSQKSGKKTHSQKESVRLG